MPGKLDDNPNLWSPGIKWNVQPGSFTHMTELFGPVLGVMSAKNLEEAIDLVNQTGYGLTSGLESLDDRERESWCGSIEAGNLYVNRVTTGAIVLRQPFGGMGKSAFGPGIKAGGPNYVAQLMTFTPSGPGRGNQIVANEQLRQLHKRLTDPDKFIAARLESSDRVAICDAIRSFDLAYAEEFGVTHDHFKLIGQDNIRRYLPVRELRIRVHPDDTAFEIFVRAAAARAAGARVTISYPDQGMSGSLEALEHATEIWGGSIEFVEESDADLAVIISSGITDRVRFAGSDRVPEVILRAVQDSGVYLARAPVLGIGRIELLWYLREQSISFDYHRYGTLGDRMTEARADTL
jgi:RHH-type proline utilization regulon transcriptional repressor/proline dehydrogenase/delta 1-pyrroline-5-carboxylate dehydrogenase